MLGDTPMKRLVAFGFLSLLAGSAVGAQEQPAPSATAGGLFARGRELLAAQRYLDAADAFGEYLSAEGRDKFTIRVAVYCDVVNLDAHLQRLGNPPELFLLRRPVGEQSCVGLFWRLFSSRSEADAALATVPAALRTHGQGSAAVSSLLVPGAFATAHPPALSPAAPPAPVTSPPPTSVAAPPLSPPVTQPAPTRPAETPGVSPTAATVRPPPAEASPVPAEPAHAAGTPSAEIGLGYSYLWDDRMRQITLTDGGTPLGLSASFWLGWVVSANVNVTDSLGIVGEASGHYRSQNAPGTALTIGTEELGFHGGLRYTHRTDAVATFYAQALFGATRFSMNLLGESEAANHFSIQPGLGIMFRVSDQVGIDVGGDYRLVFTKHGGLSLIPPKQYTNAYRFHAGVVFGVGRK
jgi:hypothetical protein